MNVMTKTVESKRPVSNVWESITPLQRWSKLFALWCFDRDQRGSYSRSFKHKVVTTILLTSYALLVLAWLPNRSKTWEIVKDVMIVTYLMDIYGIVLPITAFYSLTIVHIIAPIKIEILREIEKVDVRLVAIGYRKAMPEISSYVKQFYVVAIVYASTSVGAGFLLSTKSLLQQADVQLWLQMIVFSISYMLHLLVVIQYLVWCAVLHKRFELLKCVLQKMSATSFAVTKYPDDDMKFMAVITEVAVNYYRLTDIARKVSRAYSFSVFMQIASYFAMFLCQGYKLVYIVILTQEMNLMELTGTVYYLCAACLELFGIVYVTETLCYQANSVHETLHGIHIHPEKVTCRNKVIRTSLQLLNNKLEITACGIFKVNFALLHSVGSAITIYLTIMLQFDIATYKRRLHDFRVLGDNSTNIAVDC